MFRVGINKRPQAVGVKKPGPRSPNFNVVVVEAAKFFLHSRAFIYPAQEHSEGGIFNIEIGVAGGHVFWHTQSLWALIFPDTDQKKT